MKYLLYLIILIAGPASAQLKKSDLSSGRYLANSYTGSFAGVWKGESANVNLVIEVSPEKRHVQRGNLDVYLDILVVKVRSLVKDGKNLTAVVKNEIILVSTGESKTFTGINKDSVTGNNVRISMEIKSVNKAKLTVDLPESDPLNNPSKGFSFPKVLELVKEK